MFGLFPDSHSIGLKQGLSPNKDFLLLTASEITKFRPVQNIFESAEFEMKVWNITIIKVGV